MSYWIKGSDWEFGSGGTKAVGVDGKVEKPKETNGETADLRNLMKFQVS